MATKKRFTDTCKWMKPWFRNLTAHQKLFWSYLLDNCDHAGIWDVDLGLASFFIGVEIDDEFLTPFAKQITQVNDGKQWFIRDFVEFQYGELKPTNKLHASVLKILEKYGIDSSINNNDSPLLAPCMPLGSPGIGAKEKDKEKEKEKEKVLSATNIKRAMPLNRVHDCWLKGIEILGERLTIQDLTPEFEGTLQGVLYHKTGGVVKWLSAVHALARAPASVKYEKSVTWLLQDKFKALNRVVTWAAQDQAPNASSKTNYVEVPEEWKRRYNEHAPR